MRVQRNDQGAVAVEFALVALLLVTLVFGIAEFGRAFHLQSVLSAAAREGAREMALNNEAGTAETRTRGAFDPALGDGAGLDVTVTPSTCTPGQPVTVEAVYETAFLTGLFGETFTLTGKGVMRCNG